ncbi:hypothetical protein C8R43DRAFT_940918 [Mycena crocata]|nr:hypothetical protein C8R43DRAFT_940918 [Mycena crocata]
MQPQKKKAPNGNQGTTAKRARCPDSEPAAAVAADGRHQKRSKDTLSETRNQNCASFISEKAGSPTAPELILAPERAQAAIVADSTSSVLVGKFDLYMMDLSFLSKVFLPAEKCEPQSAELYQAIRGYQAKEDYAGRCLLPGAPFLMDGQLENLDSVDPMEEVPFDIAITDLKLVDRLSFSATERGMFVIPPQSGPGITGNTALSEYSESNHCGIQSAAGVLHMKHAWTGKGVDDEDMEIFEGWRTVHRFGAEGMVMEVTIFSLSGLSALCATRMVWRSG